MQTFIDGILLKKNWLRFLPSDGLHVHIEYFLTNQKKSSSIQQTKYKAVDSSLDAQIFRKEVKICSGIRIVLRALEAYPYSLCPMGDCRLLLMVDFLMVLVNENSVILVIGAVSQYNNSKKIKTICLCLFIPSSGNIQ